MTLDGQHAVLLPATDPILDNRLDQVVDAVSNVLDLSLAFYADNLYTPCLEGFSKFLQLGGIGFALSLQGLYFLGDHVI